MRVHLKGRVEIKPTEDPEKVRRAVEELFTVSTFENVGSGPYATLIFEGEGVESLTKLQGVLRRDRIRDAFRKTVWGKVEGRRVRFCLNKQVAYVGHVSLCEPRGESPLGPIEVEIEADDAYALLEWLSPSAPSHRRR